MPVRHLFPTAFAALALAVGLVACGGDGGGGGGGSSRAVGEEAVTEHTEIGATGAAAPKTTLGITVLKVTKGTQAQLKAGGFTLEGDELKTTPYYVDVKYTNKGTTAIKQSLGVAMEDQDDNLINSTTVLSFGGDPFENCASADSKKDLAGGQSYESCDLFLVPEGRTPKRVSFLPNSPGKETEFLYWDIG